MGKGLKAFFSILAAVIVVALIGLIAFFVMNYIDSSGNVKAFSIRHGELEVTNETHGFELPRGVAVVFEVQTLTGADKGFAAAITAAPGQDFDFTVDDQVLAFSGVKDFAPAFKLTKAGGSFSLWLAPDATMAGLLQMLHPDRTVTAPDIAFSEDLFCLTVTSGDGAKSVRLYFH